VIDGWRPAWQARAACRGMGVDSFFIDPGPFWEPEPCRACPVKMDCLAWALDHRIMHGIWGGKSERERARILKAKPGQYASQRSIQRKTEARKNG
jgi:WhiB family transcriptional regulator, redox-sensing transcriptional regulator